MPEFTQEESDDQVFKDEILHELRQKLMYCCAHHGCDEVAKQIAYFAANLTDEGRNKIITAIGESYCPTRVFSDISKPE